jgi:uncharacterized protein with beta-barrel porin domain
MKTNKKNQSALTKDLVSDSKTKFSSKALNSLAIASVVAGSTFGINNSAEAGAVILADTHIAVAADGNGNANGVTAITVNDVITVTSGDSGINTATAAMTIGALASTTADSVLAVTGTGGLTLNDATGITSNDQLLITVATDSSLDILGAVTLTEPITLTLIGSGALTLSGASKIVASAVIAAADGNGTVTLSAAVTTSSTIGADATDMGTVTVSGAATMNGNVFSKIVNVSANADFAADLNANVINMTGAATTLTLGDKVLKASGTTSVLTMNVTDQKVILDGTDIISTNITAATDGFGEVEIDTAATVAGIIGTSATVKVGLVDVDAGGILQNSVFADAVKIANSQTLSFTGAVEDMVVTAAVDGDSTTAAQGTLTINTTANAATAITFQGAVGATGELAAIVLTTDANFNSSVTADAITPADGKVATFLGDVTVGAADLTATGTALFSGTAAQTIVGDASGSLIDGAGLISVTNASSGGMKFGANALMSSDTLDFAVSGAAAKAVITLKDNIVEEANLGTGAILEIDDTFTDGDKVFETTTDQDKDSVHASSIIKIPSNIIAGQTLKLFSTIQTNSNNEALLVADVNSALRDSAISDFTATLTQTDDVTVTTSAKTAATTASELGTTVNEARALHQIATALLAGSAAEIDILTDTLNATNGVAATVDTDLAQQAAPQTEASAGSTSGVKAMTGTVQSIVSNRMASLRSGDAYVTGVSAGNGMSANSGFIQAFSSQVEQDNTKKNGANVFGYDSETSGVAIGFDGLTDAGSTLGLSASFSSTDVDGNGTGKAKNSIDSYTVSVYADKSTENGYLEGSLTYGINDNSSSRLVNVAGLNRSYTGDYDSEQISLKISGGTPNEVSDGTYVTPFIGVSGSIIQTDGYTEKSTTANDVLRLRIEQDEVTSVIGSVGVKAHKVTDKGTPMISLAVNNEFADTEINSTNTYQGGGTTFETSTEVEELTATLGLGYSFGSDMTSLNVGYEGTMDADEEYISHYGSIKIVSKF